MERTKNIGTSAGREERKEETHPAEQPTDPGNDASDRLEVEEIKFDADFEDDCDDSVREDEDSFESLPEADIIRHNCFDD